MGIRHVSRRWIGSRLVGLALVMFFAIGEGGTCEAAGDTGDAEMRAVHRLLEVMRLECPSWVGDVRRRIHADRVECGVVEDQGLARERLDRWITWKVSRGTGKILDDWVEEERGNLRYALRTWATAGHDYVFLLLWVAGREDPTFTVVWRAASGWRGQRRGEGSLRVLPPP